MDSASGDSSEPVSGGGIESTKKPEEAPTSDNHNFA
jgi:hypothetical protein